ncbi:twin-arginine translocation signal domain-containing protein [Roseibium sediminis]|uniref:twin-arginine translocation signal domain-containing protein n=1 Tax=Roseibium sediminis TaxID=1775174 RepID=UPI00123CCD77|nr:twin-arginine translocation signal domain-containing protein [Roseibium sediminis]
MDKKTPDSADRRNFLKLAGLGTLASGATVVAGAAEAAAPSQDAGTGYRETDHVKRVYETARF